MFIIDQFVSVVFTVDSGVPRTVNQVLLEFLTYVFCLGLPLSGRDTDRMYLLV